VIVLPFSSFIVRVASPWLQPIDKGLISRVAHRPHLLHGEFEVEEALVLLIRLLQIKEGVVAQVHLEEVVAVAALAVGGVEGGGLQVGGLNTFNGTVVLLRFKHEPLNYGNELLLFFNDFVRFASQELQVLVIGPVLVHSVLHQLGFLQVERILILLRR